MLDRTIAGSIRRPGTWALTVALCLVFASEACHQSRHEQGALKPAFCEAPANDGPLIVKTVEQGRINVGDRTLREWSPNLFVMDIPPEVATRHQWNSIRGRAPNYVSSGDAGLRVGMARDASNWYISAEVMDDRIVVSRQTEHPYGGDAFEIFFAGPSMSTSDYSFHVAQPAAPHQGAFLQLVVPAPHGRRPAGYLAAHRTDAAVLANATRPGSAFLVSTWRTKNGWNAEIRLPLDLFDDEVRNAISSGRPLRIGLDLLDYDGEPAPLHSEPPFRSFKPDNVFCWYPAECNVTIPACMRVLLFEQRGP